MKTDSASLSDHHYFGFIVEDRYLQKRFHRAVILLHEPPNLFQVEVYRWIQVKKSHLDPFCAFIVSTELVGFYDKKEVFPISFFTFLPLRFILKVAIVPRSRYAGCFA